MNQVKTTYGGYVVQHPSTFTEGALFSGLNSNFSTFKSGTESAWANTALEHEGDVAITDSGVVYMFINGAWKAL